MTKLLLLTLLLSWPDAGVTPVRWVQICEVKPEIIEHAYDPIYLVAHGHFECSDGGSAFDDGGFLTIGGFSTCQYVEDLYWTTDAGPKPICHIEPVLPK